MENGIKKHAKVKCCHTINKDSRGCSKRDSLMFVQILNGSAQTPGQILWTRSIWGFKSGTKFWSTIDGNSFPQLHFIRGVAGGWTLFCLIVLRSWWRTGFAFHSMFQALFAIHFAGFLQQSYMDKSGGKTISPCLTFSPLRWNRFRSWAFLLLHPHFKRADLCPIHPGSCHLVSYLVPIFTRGISAFSQIVLLLLFQNPEAKAMWGRGCWSLLLVSGGSRSVLLSHVVQCFVARLKLREPFRD